MKVKNTTSASHSWYYYHFHQIRVVLFINSSRTVVYSYTNLVCDWFFWSVESQYLKFDTELTACAVSILLELGEVNVNQDFSVWPWKQSNPCSNMLVRLVTDLFWFEYSGLYKDSQVFVRSSVGLKTSQCRGGLWIFSRSLQFRLGRKFIPRCGTSSIGSGRLGVRASNVTTFPKMLWRLFWFNFCCHLMCAIVLVIMKSRVTEIFKISKFLEMLQTLEQWPRSYFESGGRGREGWLVTQRGGRVGWLKTPSGSLWDLFHLLLCLE